MITVKQIADELGIDKQRVYRYIKQNHINEAVQNGQVKWYDDAVLSLVKSAFLEDEPHQMKRSEPLHDAVNDTVLDAVLQQLKTKDEQIAALQLQVTQLTTALENTTASLKAAQALHAGTMQQALTESANQSESTVHVPDEPESAVEQPVSGFRAWLRSVFG